LIRELWTKFAERRTTHAMSDVAHERSYRDYQNGVGIYGNPYPENTIEFRRWVDDWVESVIDEHEFPDCDSSSQRITERSSMNLAGVSVMTSKADLARYDRLQRIGCVVARKLGLGWMAPDIHHIVQGYRLGNQYTIPLNPWSHRGVLPDGMTAKQAYELLGPSLALQKKAFFERFGTERELLAEVNELVILGE
jgi:hypothetical protein